MYFITMTFSSSEYLSIYFIIINFCSSEYLHIILQWEIIENLNSANASFQLNFHHELLKSEIHMFKNK